MYLFTLGKCMLMPNRSEEHMARDCDQPRDVSTVTCRNCDESGHFSQDCPKPRDYSRVKCNNCGESTPPDPLPPLYLYLYLITG